MAQTKNHQLKESTPSVNTSFSRAQRPTNTRAALEAQNSAKELSDILGYFPYGPGFLGDKLIYAKEKKGLFSRKPNKDLSDLRREVNNFTNKQGLSQCRTEIKSLIKSYPTWGEVHALNAILVFNDAMQAGSQDLNKLKIIRDSLTELAKAMHNGSLSLFNVNWLMAMYTSYLGFLTDRLKRLNSAMMEISDPEMNRRKKELDQQLMMIRHLGVIQERQKGLRKLNSVLKKTGMFVKPLEPLMIGKAAQAYLQGGKEKTVGDERVKSGLILQMHFMLANLLGHAPIMSNLVKSMLDMVPEIHRDFVLQKRMVMANEGSIEFYLALGRNDTEHARALVDQLMLFHAETIAQNLNEALLDRPFMIDPILKMGYLIKDAQHIIRPDQLAAKAQKVLPYLRVLLSERCQVAGGSQVASVLIYDMQRILARLGY
ncbi:MAG: hypothetical protein RRB13_02065 [bacterium]|nr:hypothetical protein [bacterium]